MAMSSPVAGSASAGPPAMVQNQDPTQGQDTGDLTAFAGQLRQIGQQCDQVSQQNPDVASEMQQVKAILRQAIVKKAQSASMQTPSAQALPMSSS